MYRLRAMTMGERKRSLSGRMMARLKRREAGMPWSSAERRSGLLVSRWRRAVLRWRRMGE